VAKGTYSLSLKMSDIATKNKISFANASVNEDGSVFILQDQLDSKRTIAGRKSSVFYGYFKLNMGGK